jgi:DHA1 family tetracycline resistance protein-like MFS transporter
LAHTVLPSIFVLYAGFRYHWGSDMVGLTMMLTASWA